MLSGTLERAGSPRKRTLSRGVSEDESLRCIIKETESTPRRLTRSDSKGTLKRRSESQQTVEEDVMSRPEMMELQANYEDVQQELRGLELGREVLLFQVDVLQEALQSTEEMLIEAQREANQASMELAREREEKSKLEETVSALRQEMERLMEERTAIPAVPVYSYIIEEEDGLGRRETQRDENPAKEEAKENKESDSSHDAPHLIDRLESIPLDTPRCSESPGVFSYFRRQSKASPSRAPPLSDSQLGSSVDLEEEDEEQGVGATAGGDGPLTKLQKMVNKTFDLSLGSQPTPEGVLRSPRGSQAEEETGRDPSPDRGKDTDSISAYEDAVADTPELENVFPGSAKDLGSTVLYDAGEDEGREAEEGDPANNSQNSGPRSPNESCLVS